MIRPQHVPLVSAVQPPTYSTYNWPRRFTHKQAIALQQGRLPGVMGEPSDGRRFACIALCRPLTRPFKGDRRRVRA